MPLTKNRLFSIYFILFLLVPLFAQASDFTLQKQLHDNFKNSQILLVKIESALVSGQPYQDSLSELKALGELIRTDHFALLNEFNTRSLRLHELGARAVSRHTAMKKRYQQSVSQFLFSLDALNDSQASLDEILQLKQILKSILREKKRRIHGSLPYRHLNLPAQTPQYSPIIVPAYKGGDQNFTDADLTASPEANISPPIANLAESLNWNPVEMYEWVKNNIKTEWYWGAMKGAEETLRQMSGNDSDQATLLVALFRSAGFPARYVRGVVEFFPDIEAAKEQIGLDDPLEIARFFQRAGIPYETVITGGRISNFKIEHIWVEVRIPYDNYRGVLLDEHGQTWLPLDTNIKAAGYTTNTPDDSLTTLDLTGIREDYLAGFIPQTPMEYLADQINDQLINNGLGTTYDNLLLDRKIKQEHMQILPENLQFTEIAITGEYASLPDELVHKARFVATAPDNTVFFEQSLPVHSISNKSIAVTFEPETIEDQEIMNACGGLGYTPLYLIHLRPLITVDGIREIVGQGGMAAGADFSLTVELVGPLATEQTENTLVAGYPTIIGLSAQQAIKPEPIALDEKNAERLLHERAISYIEQGNKSEQELASLLQMHFSRPLPTVVTLGGVLEVISLLDSSHGFNFTGVYLDADMRFVELFGGVSPANFDPAQLFMQLASLENSIQENRVFEEGFEVESVSTAKLLAIAGDKDIPVAVIDTENIDTDLPSLNLPDSIAEDITSAVNQGFVVTIPETELLYEDWLGFAYIKEKPETYESGWMLSGEIAGGMSAWGLDRWSDYLLGLLINPFIEPPNTDPESGVSLQKIASTDMQTAEVGTLLEKTMQVIVRDKDNNPVEGVPVTFKVKAGGGNFTNNSDTITVTSNTTGIAEAEYTLGMCTGTCMASNGTPLPQGNPAYLLLDPSDTYQTQIGKNLISASLDSGVSITTPFTHYAIPGNPIKTDVLPGANSSGEVLTWIGPIGVRVMDQYSNPVANVAVDFNVADPVEKKACPTNPNMDMRPALLIKNDAPCMKNVPLYGQCGAGSVSGVLSYTTGEASVQVILGGMPDADYVITASADNVQESKEFVVTTYEFGACDGYSFPWRRIVINSPYTVDGNGHIANAVKVGSTLPMQAKVYWVLENDKIVSLINSCQEGNFQCDDIAIGAREYDIITEFNSESVTFDGQQAVSSGQGQDKIFDIMYDVGNSPVKKSVTIHADTKKEVLFNKDVCSTNCRAELGTQTLYDHITVDVYAVDIKTDQNVLIPLDELGYAKCDIKIPFTILPAEYTSSSTTVVLYKNGMPIQYIPAELQGEGFATISAGFQFDPDSTYIAQIILNVGSDIMEIESDIITLELITLELDADLNKDNNYLEDDPEEETAPGLILSVNHNDDDGDGIEDRLDGFDLDPAITEDDAFTDPSGANLVDNDLIPVQLHGLPGDLNQGTITLELVSGQDKVRILADNTKEHGTDSILIDTTDPDAATGLLLGSTYEWTLDNDETPVTMADLPSLIYIEGINSSTSPGDVRLAIKYSRNQGEEIETDTIVMTVVQVDMVPDYNRDGEINESDRNKVTETEPWRFWVNDDDDDSAGDNGLGGNDLPGQGKDIDNKINGLRDMVDFFPLYLDLKQTLGLLPPSQGYVYKLKNNDGSIGFVEGFDDQTVLTRTYSSEFLEEFSTSVVFCNKEVKVVDQTGQELSTDFLAKIQESDENGLLLVEGQKAYTSPLILEISKNDQVVHFSSFPLEIVSVQKMFGHKNIRSVAGGSGGAQDLDLASVDAKVPFCQHVDQTLVWVHGYNNDGDAATATFAEVYKRLFQAGYNGKFYGVSWFGDPPAPTAPHYHQAVVNAFATAETYAQFVNNLSVSGKVSVVGHSLGNMVVGAAIQDHDLDSFAKYFAVDAAVALEAYGDKVKDESMIKVDGWLDYWSYTTDGGSTYPARKLLASEWYTLFPQTDNRHKLTWRDRLNKVPTAKLYNFYSSTEEVLQKYDNDALVGIPIWWNLDRIVTYLSTATWVKQEKFKGRRTIWNVPDNFGGSSSRYCGWSFNDEWYTILPGEGGDPDIKIKIPPDDIDYADLINKNYEQLKSKPFFDLCTTSGTNCFGIDLLASEDQEGIDFVDKKIEESEYLGNYYTDNSTAHSIVTVRDWLLAESFPATTLPMGANPNNVLDFDHNINMSTTMKTSENDWPRNDTLITNEGDWYHSDYKDVPYQHVYEFYKKINRLSEQ